MMIHGLGLHYSIPSNYEYIIAQLKKFGLSPTGDMQFDKSRLLQAIRNEEEQQREILRQEEAKEIRNQQNRDSMKEVEEKRVGANVLAEQNKVTEGETE